MKKFINLHHSNPNKAANRANILYGSYSVTYNQNVALDIELWHIIGIYAVFTCRFPLNLVHHTCLFSYFLLFRVKLLFCYLYIPRFIRVLLSEACSRF